MKRTEYFKLLDSVGSTNNYAMAEVHAGLATHGMAWFAKEQHAGKGQRGKKWIANPGENIMMSIVIEVNPVFGGFPFMFNMVIANACHYFLNNYCDAPIKIKWPNDLYINDRKAGGILIENIYRGSLWKWAVVGIGMNINQQEFPPELNNATSVKLASGKDHDAIELGRRLHRQVLEAVALTKRTALPEIINYYNEHLFKRGEPVKLRRENMLFETTIDSVNEKGQLLSYDTIPRHFEFGEIEWVL